MFKFKKIFISLALGIFAVSSVVMTASAGSQGFLYYSCDQSDPSGTASITLNDASGTMSYEFAFGGAFSGDSVSTEIIAVGTTGVECENFWWGLNGKRVDDEAWGETTAELTIKGNLWVGTDATQHGAGIMDGTGNMWQYVLGSRG